MSATGPETGSSSTSTAVPFFKKKTRPTTSRKRDTSPSTTTTTTTTTTTPNTTRAAPDSIPSRISNGASEVVAPTRKTVANPLIQGTKRTLSQRDDSSSLDDHLGPDVKWKASGSTLSAVEREREALSAEEERSLLKKARREAEDEERADDGLYHGATSYKSHIKKREDGVPKAMRVGPQKSTSTIRTVTVIDYQPDVCKDYKETGYCGFGDTCKFLHDRGTYLQGWQLDKIAADPKKKAAAEESDTDEEDIPWACYICRKPYTDPVVTRCQHYFCSACAIKRFAKTPKCAACSAPTGGIFNRADKVVEKMRAAVRAKEEKEMRGEDDEDTTGRPRDLELELDLPER